MARFELLFEKEQQTVFDGIRGTIAEIAIEGIEKVWLSKSFMVAQERSAQTLECIMSAGIIARAATAGQLPHLQCQCVA